MPGISAANFTVTKTDDTNDGVCDADCSLREAVHAANSKTEANIITLPAGTYTLTLAGANEDNNATGDLDIITPYTLSIVGVGPGRTLINANGIDRAFHLLTGTKVISGLTIYNGRATGVGLVDGGGVYGRDANFSLINTVIYSNSASNNGAGVYVSAGDAILKDTLIYGNAVVNFGGGVYVSSGSAVLAETQVFSNTAGNSGGGVYVGTGSAVLTGTHIYSNAAVNNGGGVLANQGSLSLTGVTVRDNRANFGAGVHVAAGSAVLTGTRIFSNVADNGGGGLYVSTGKATITGTHIFHNLSLSGGGVFVASGSATLAVSDIRRNAAGGSGGGVYVSTGNVSLTGTTILSNSAGTTGGALYLVSSGTITAANGCIVFNTHSAVARTNVVNGQLVATDNWWGAANGPGGAGTGNGDTVSAGVTYEPFKSAPPAGCPTLPRVYLPVVLK